MTFATTSHLASALDQLLRLFGAVEEEQLSLPTPCSEWNVRQLAEHIIQAQCFFIKMIAPETQGQKEADSLHALRDAVDANNRTLRAAWNAPGALDGTYSSPFGQLPGAAAIDYHTIEMTIHGWDLATALKKTAMLDEGLGTYVLAAAEKMIPAGVREGRIGSEVAVDAGAPIYDRFAGFMGRKPTAP